MRSRKRVLASSVSCLIKSGIIKESSCFAHHSKISELYYSPLLRWRFSLGKYPGVIEHFCSTFESVV